MSQKQKLEQIAQKLETISNVFKKTDKTRTGKQEIKIIFYRFYFVCTVDL